MQLKDKLIHIPKREDAGGRTSNRYSFQHSWAFLKLLELVSSGDDFVMVMEFFDDVIVLDSSSNPQNIDFYQVKTNTKKSERYVTSRTIVSTSKKERESIGQKLIDNLSRFPNETRTIHLVSTKAYKFTLSNKIDDATSKLTISLNEICNNEVNKIKRNICSNCFCNKCVYPKGCSERCRKIIYFDVSDIDIYTYDDTVFGRFLKFLADNDYGAGSILNSRAVYYTIMSEIVRINNNERKATSFKELLTSKSITKSKFDLFLTDFKRSISMENDWSDISNALRSRQENYGSIEINAIRKQWDRYKADTLGSDLPILDVIKNDIRRIIASSDFGSYREYIDHVHIQIKDQEYYKRNLFNKNYYTAITLGELYYEK